MTTPLDIGTLIDRNPDIHRGTPILAGTGVTVRRIAIESNSGLTPEEIAREIPHLTLAQVHAALTYYYANQEAMDVEIAAYFEECDRLEEESTPRAIRNHKAFLNSYAPEDEGLYDDY